VNIKLGPTTPNAGADVAVCKGQSTQLSGSASNPTTNAISQSASPGTSIPDDNSTGISSTISIPQTCAIANQITSVSVNISHTYNSDLEIYLRAPDGTQIALSEDKGGSGDNYNCTFITGGSALPTSNSTITGNRAPQTPFSSLGSGTAQGTWTLIVRDVEDDDIGTLNSWSINIPSATCNNPITYSWSPATGLSNANIESPTASPTATTTYTMTATSNGCSVSDDVIVTVNNYGIDGNLAASTTTSVCVNNPITVTAASGDGNPRYWLQSPVGAATWNIADNQASNSASNGYTYTPTSTGTFRIHARWQNNCGFCWDEAGHDFNTNNKCPNFAAVDFTVVAQPTAPTSASKLPNTVSTCAGSTLTLTGAASGGEAGLSCSIEYQYSTNNGTNWISTGTSIPSFTAVAGTNIIQARRASCQSGCGSTSWNTIASWTITANPVASITGTNTVCLGNNSIFTASGGATYAWNTGATTASITIATANTYTVTVTDANGCSSSTNRTLTVNQPNTNISVIGISISNGDYLWNGSSNATWDVVANWYVFNGSNYIVATTLPTTLTNVFISSSAGQCVSNTNNVTIPSSAPVQSVKDISISNGSQVVLAGSNNFNVSGNWNNAGTFNATAGNVVLYGSSNQTFSCGGGSSIKDITIENTALSGKVTMNSNLELSGTVYINNGELVVPATRIVRSNKVNMGSNGKLLLGGEMRVNE
jgi:subtilisin-like proprotein convertase family protein